MVPNELIDELGIRNACHAQHPGQSGTRTKIGVRIHFQDVGLPLSSWTLLGPPVPIGGGVYQFTDTDSVNHPRRFYELRAP